MKKYILTALLLCLGVFYVSPALAEEANVKATVDKQQVQLNEEVHLNIKISGFRGSIQAPQLPSFEGFDVFYSGRSSKYSFINGRSEAMTEFNYVLIPKLAGRFVLRPIEIKIGAQTYQTDQIQIDVDTAVAQGFRPQPVPAQRPTPMQPQAQPQNFPSAPTAMPFPQQPSGNAQTSSVSNAEIDQNIFLKAVPSQVSVFTNQQLVLTYLLYTRYDTRYEGFVEEPETSGFWIEEFPMDQNIGRDTEVVNGKKFIKAEVKKIALFPTAPGEYEIKPGIAKTSVQIEDESTMMDEFFKDSFFNSSGMFGRRVEKMLAPPAIRIQVKPLPESGKPESFKGAVGEFRMATHVDKREVNQNEAVTLQITLEGQGNIETLGAPALPEMKEAKVYEADTQTQLFRAQGVIAGKKSFEIVVIPGQAGELLIPSMEFSFFNPKTERYVVLKSDSYKIKVNPSDVPAPVLPKELQWQDSKKQIKSEAEDIQYIKEKIISDRFDFTRLVVYWLAILNGLLTVSGIGLLLMRRRNEYLDQHVPLKRTMFAKKYASKGLSRLNHLAKSTNSQTDESFFDESAKILNQYLSDKLNLSTYGLTQEVIERSFDEKQIEPAIVEKIKNCYAICDQVRFAKRGVEGIDRNAVIQQIREIIYGLERKK